MARQRIIIHAIAALISVLIGLQTKPRLTFACEIRVRDSAFRTTRDFHRLCVIADRDDESADQIFDHLEAWLSKSDGTLNLEIERIDADDPETDWRSLGIPSAPPMMPVTVLVGRDNGIGEHFVIDHWEQAPTEDDLLAIGNSPVRQQLAKQLASNIAVLIYAPGDLPTGRAIADRLKNLISEKVADERIGLSMITLDRTDPAERLLCRFMGIRPNSPDTLCVSFGRGKLMSPPLLGDEITRDNINNLVTQIRQACSCSKPLSTMGVDIPLVWSDSIDSSVVLMDDEIKLSELEAEVQSMLAAKSAADSLTDATEIAIPPGKQSGKKTASANAAPAAAMKLQTSVLAILLGIATIAIYLLVAKARRQSSTIDSAR